ncbi:MAG: polysaccharide deacetylase family protein [Bacilli bacterium]|nr:polysaccharide deacetylase family protein [Bacilli bacterium]
MKKKRLKKKYIIIVIVAVILLLVLLFFLFGDNFLKLETKSKKTTEVEYATKDFKYPKVTCKYLGIDKSKNIKRLNNIDLKKVGKQDIKYSCKTLTFKKDIKVKYDVVDKVAPEMKLKGDKSLTIYVGEKYVDKGVTATDNVDGDISKKVVVEGTVNTKKEGKTEITYTITDSSGNKTTLKRTVTVKKRPVNGPRYSGGGSSMGCGEAGVIYLTFDDGPNGLYTPVILDALKKHGVKATFFVTMAGPDSMIKREYNEGHAVALHTASHDYGYIYSSSANYWADLNKVSARVERLTGKKSMLMRFPGGVSNTISRHYKNGIMSQLAKEVEDKGYTYFDWNISSGDAGGTTDPNQEYRNVVNSLSKSRGNVILMHDIKKHTSLAIDSIIKYGKDNGYQFKVLTSDVICHQGINN